MRGMTTPRVITLKLIYIWVLSDTCAPSREWHRRGNDMQLSWDWNIRIFKCISYIIKL